MLQPFYSKKRRLFFENNFFHIVSRTVENATTEPYKCLNKAKKV